MDSPHALKARIASIKNIRQITKAMELVAATKMRKSQEIALASRPYALEALRLLKELTNLPEDRQASLPPLLVPRPIAHRLFVLVTSDKGLAGSFNGAVLRTFDRMCTNESIDLTGERYRCIGIGQKAIQHLKRRGAHIEASFVRAGDYASVEQVRPIADAIIEGYENASWDTTTVFSTHFRNALKQDVLVRSLLPITFESVKALIDEITSSKDQTFEQQVVPNNTDYLLEPSPFELLTDLSRHLVLMQVYHLILEANASEHSARRAAMKSAADNARDLGESLGLLYNKSRQAAITKEIIEISAGSLTS